jgi:hypothetical protein
MNVTAHPSPVIRTPQLLQALVGFAVACVLVLTASLVVGATGVFTVVVSLLFVVLWLAFAYGVLFERQLLDAAWRLIRRRHLLIEAAIWLLFLPVVAGLWIWQRRWPLTVRLVLVASIAAVNLIMFLGG